MGTRFQRLQIIELETTGGEWPMVYGKGQRKDDLIYFQLDANFLRQPKNVRKGGFITVTEEEVSGVSPGHFKASDLAV